MGSSSPPHHIAASRLPWPQMRLSIPNAKQVQANEVVFVLGTDNRLLLIENGVMIDISTRYIFQFARAQRPRDYAKWVLFLRKKEADIGKWGYGSAVSRGARARTRATSDLQGS